MIVDLRSDTVTRPSKEMLERMISAPTGDDVLNEDPTVNELQRFSAQLFGMEDALYCSSGTQTNQIAINVHTQPGDEVICSSLSHIYIYEGGGVALNSLCSMAMVEGDRGRLTAEQVINMINPDDIHRPISRLISLEDTVNKGGGAVYDFDEIKKIKSVASQRGLALHCDGARLFNALHVNGLTPAQYAEPFDSISICLSKGLGAPVGSILLGKKDFINKARRRRKSFGGGMRQAGIIAAAGLYALQNNVERLKDDHNNAKLIASELMNMSWVKSIMPVDTNIVIFSLSKENGASEYVEKLKSRGILCFPFGSDKIRMVTHLDLADDHYQYLFEVLKTIS
ncbi:MAG: low-specificity L-threonine aldolase [Flavobacteriales bacterium]|jgi:threonine aldolase